MNPLINLIGLIPGAAKYLPLAKFLANHGKTVTDLAITSGKAVEAIEKTDPTIIPHLEELTKDLVKNADGMPLGADIPHADPRARELAKHTVARALVHPDSLSANERAWMERASAGGG
jgi:hypothetical protein